MIIQSSWMKIKFKKWFSFSSMNEIKTISRLTFVTLANNVLRPLSQATGQIWRHVPYAVNCQQMVQTLPEKVKPLFTLQNRTDDIHSWCSSSLVISSTTLLRFTIENNTDNSQTVPEHSSNWDGIPKYHYWDYNSHSPFCISKDLREP